MTLYTFPAPDAVFRPYILSLAATHPAGTTCTTAFPSSAISAPHIQLAWDGTPAEDASRERAAMRITVWTPKGQPGTGKDLASLVRAQLLAFASATVWRVTRGAGRAAGTDPATGLPFVTFTVNAETRPSAVA